MNKMLILMNILLTLPKRVNRQNQEYRFGFGGISERMIHPFVFYVLATLIVGFALLVVTVRNIFHSGLCLIGTFLGVAGIYVSLHNYFLAATQLLIYSGAIAVLILFGIMMTQRSWSLTSRTHNSLWLIGIPVSAMMAFLMIRSALTLPDSPIKTVWENLLQAIGSVLMQVYVLPFEIISVVLLVALIGAMALGKESEEA